VHLHLLACGLTLRHGEYGPEGERERGDALVGPISTVVPTVLGRETVLEDVENTWA